MVRDRVFLKMFTRDPAKQISQDEVDYFKKHPEEIDDITSPVNLHKFFLLLGLFVGLVVVVFAKFLKFGGLFDFMGEATRETVVDVFYELGVAFVGAAATAYLLGILLNSQQRNARKYRDAIRKLIEEQD